MSARTETEMLAAELGELAEAFRDIIDLMIGFAPTENDCFQLDAFRDALKRAKEGQEQAEGMSKRFCGSGTEDEDEHDRRPDPEYDDVVRIRIQPPTPPGSVLHVCIHAGPPLAPVELLLTVPQVAELGAELTKLAEQAAAE